MPQKETGKHPIIAPSCQHCKHWKQKRMKDDWAVCTKGWHCPGMTITIRSLVCVDACDYEYLSSFDRWSFIDDPDPDEPYCLGAEALFGDS